jgi:DHA1 family multidrug resistance protein-like MFS transporter/DHA1 family quinolone resistance protein-like MFS transporter
MQIIRAYSSGIGKEGVLYPASFGVSLCVGQVALALIFYAQDILHLSPTRVGQLASTWSVTYVLGLVLLRPLLRDVLPRYLIIASNVLMFACIAGFSVTTSPAVAFVLYAGFGAALCLFWPSTMAWLSAEREGPTLGRVLSRFNLSWGIAAAVSPYVCGWLLASYSPRLPLRLSAFVFLLIAVFVAGAAVVLPRVRQDRSTGAPEKAATEDRSTPLRLPGWVGAVACHFGIGVLVSIFPMAARDQMAMSERVIGRLLLFHSLANVVGFMILGKTHAWHFRLSPMVVSLVVRGLVLVGLIFARSIGVISLYMVLFGLTSAALYSFSIFHGASGSANRSRRMAVHEACLGAGLLLGATCGGAVYERVGIGHVFAVAAILSMAAAFVQLVMGAIILLHARQCDCDMEKETCRASAGTEMS